jgi:dCMP deaminase
MTQKWNERFMQMAITTASWSKDPKRKVGCVIVNQDKIILSTGFNGFPRGVRDDARLIDRDIKLLMIVHAEANAIASAARQGHSLIGSTMYVNSEICSQCAALAIQAGIIHIVMKKVDRCTSWRMSHDIAKEMLSDIGVTWEEEL